MPIRFACLCGNRVTVADADAGRRVRCPRCKRLVVVPPESERLTTETTIEVRRPRTAFGALTDLGLWVNGRQEGWVQNGQPRFLRLPPGVYTVEVAAARFSSRAWRVRLAEGESAAFECRPAFGAPVLDWVDAPSEDSLKEVRPTAVPYERHRALLRNASLILGLSVGCLILAVVFYPPNVPKRFANATSELLAGVMPVLAGIGGGLAFLAAGEVVVRGLRGLVLRARGRIPRDEVGALSVGTALGVLSLVVGGVTGIAYYQLLTR